MWWWHLMMDWMEKEELEDSWTMNDHDYMHVMWTNNSDYVVWYFLQTNYIMNHLKMKSWANHELYPATLQIWASLEMSISQILQKLANNQPFFVFKEKYLQFSIKVIYCASCKVHIDLCALASLKCQKSAKFCKN